jgi:hypothetical protein
VRRGFVEAGAGWSSLAGAEAWAGAGYRLATRSALFAGVKWTPRETIADVGWRYNF